MIICERCGNAMPNNSLLCLVCGTLSVFSRPDIHTPTRNEAGSAPFSIPREKQEEYEQQMDNPQPDYALFPGEQPEDLSPSSHLYSALAPRATTTPIAPVVSSTPKKALFIEAVLNLCLGIFGVGWLIAGETVTGLVLLACSLILYWPTLFILFFLNFIFSIGPGLYALIFLAPGVTTLNLLLLRRMLKSKANV